MKREIIAHDLCIVLDTYKKDINEGRIMLYQTFPLVFKDAIKKNRLSLENQELYEFDDLESECYVAIDYLFDELSKNEHNKPIFKKNKIVGYHPLILSCSHIKGYIYQIICRKIQNCATEKFVITAPFNKNGTSSLVSNGYGDGIIYNNINNKVTYDSQLTTSTENMCIDSDAYIYNDNVIDRLENDYRYAMVLNAIESFPYLEKKIFTMKYVEGMSAQEIADDIGMSKQNILRKIHRINYNLKKGIKDEKTNTGTSS